MKKLITILLLFALTVSVISCNKKAPTMSESENSDTDSAGGESNEAGKNDETSETYLACPPYDYMVLPDIESYREYLLEDPPNEVSFISYDDISELGEFSRFTGHWLSYEEFVYEEYEYRIESGGMIFFVTVSHGNSPIPNYEKNTLELSENSDLRTHGDYSDHGYSIEIVYHYAISPIVDGEYFDYSYDIILCYDILRDSLEGICWNIGDVLNNDNDTYVYLYFGVSGSLLRNYYDMSNDELNKFLNSDTIEEAVWNLTQKIVYGSESQ